VFIVAWPQSCYTHGGDRSRWTSTGLKRKAGSQVGPAADTDCFGYERSGDAWGRRRGSADSGVAASNTSRDGWDEGWTEPAGLVRGSDAAERGDAVADAHGRGREVGTELDSEPSQDPADRRAPWQHFDGHLHPGSAISWGQFEPAIRQWERLTRPAPAPTELSAKGNQRLSPAFVEWMMGLPLGHVTDVPGLTRNEQLKALGNGVVPQQAEAALRVLLNAMAVAA
jgi:DNA (cytosine-5)-methyltransferase 1